MLEEQLKQHGLTLRHYPQSFEYSTLGGWVATRAGGHFATLWTHIDDLVESVRAITPSGEWESRRLPGSGAGPSPDRMLIGSEGMLGVITEAWVRVQERPRFRASAGVEFDDFAAGAAAARALAQSGLHPSNCRLLDEGEAALTGASASGKAVLVLGFESADHPLDAWTGAGAGAVRGPRRVGEGVRRAARRRRGLVARRLPAGAVPARHDGRRGDAGRDVRDRDHLGPLRRSRALGARRPPSDALGEGRVTCRLTHVYPDGAAPYFTVLAPARRGAELAQWQEVKDAAGEAILAGGGTITHHHAVGRDHRPWYDRQRPEPFAAALRAAKRELDPHGILNPGVLV